MKEILVSVRDLSKSFGALKAVDGLSFDVYRGDVFGFLGPNGAGKSTSIRMLLSLIRPDSGSIEILGHPQPASRKEILYRVGCIVEKPDFYDYLSAYRNLEILGRLHGADISKKAIDQLLDLVGLNGRGRDAVSSYSQGMKQRLGLAQSLLHDPELIILDEPTTGLDPQGIIDIRNLILHLSRTMGKTIVLSSHILYELELVANRMVIINKGKTVVEGELSELLHNRPHVVRVTIDQPDAAAASIRASMWSDYFKTSEGQTLIFECSGDQVPELNKWLVEGGYRVFNLESLRQLEDFFLQLVHAEVSGTQSLAMKG